MRTKWMIIPAIAITLGCTREMDANVTYIDGEFTLFASSGEEGTKTILQQDGSVFWSPGDCINVFYGNQSGMFTSANDEAVTSTEFTGSLGSFTYDGETEFVASYPYSDATSLTGGTISISLPSDQTAVEGTFADDLFICVAKSKDFYLHFYNVCGGVKFSLARDDIKKVVFRGNNGETLAGRMGVEFTSEGKPSVTKFTTGSTFVTLFAPDGGTFKKGSFYYLVVAPQVLRNGFSMDLYTNEYVETIKSESSVTVRRSAWGVLKDLGTSSQNIEVDGAVDLGLPSGLLWATCNLGATRPEGFGNYYAWGETRTKDEYSWETYKWCEGDENSLTKYGGQYGFDGKDRLDLMDDAAYVNLGGKWLIPMPEDFSELISTCTWTWTTKRGVHGFSVRGPNGNSLFLPAAGLVVDSHFYDEEEFAEYTTSTVSYWYPEYSNALYLRGPYEDDDAYYHVSGYCDRYAGRTIRPIYFIPIESVSIDSNEFEVSNFQESIVLRAEVSPEDAMNKRFSWNVDGIVRIAPDNDICTVIFDRTAGSAAVTVDADNDRTETKTASCRVVSKIYITDAGIDDPEYENYSLLTSIDIIPGEGYSFTPVYSPEDATEFTTPCGWRSDDPSIATVKNGKVVGVKAGTTTIYVQYRSWNNTIVEGGCTVNVINPTGSHEGFHDDYWD